MKKNNLVEIKAMSTESIEIKIKDLKKQIVDQKLERAMDKLKNTKAIWKLRHEVAVLATILNQKMVISANETEKGVAK